MSQDFHLIIWEEETIQELSEAYIVSRATVIEISSRPSSLALTSHAQGDQDLKVPYTSIKAVAGALSWAGQNQFRHCVATDEKKYNTLKYPQIIGSKTYGNYVTVGPLTYARIFGAGHMINENEPKGAKNMFETWIFDNGKFAERPDCPAVPPQPPFESIEL